VTTLAPPNPHPTYGDITAATPIQRAHIALEDQLIEMRDSRVSMLGPANGLVVHERDGSPSDIIRIPTAVAIRVALEVALADLADCPAVRTVCEATDTEPSLLAENIRDYLLRDPS